LGWDQNGNILKLQNNYNVQHLQGLKGFPGITTLYLKLRRILL